MREHDKITGGGKPLVSLAKTNGGGIGSILELNNDKIHFVANLPTLEDIEAGARAFGGRSGIA